MEVADTLHLQKRGETWFYYRRIPRHLVPALGKQFIKRSLGVTSLADAKKLRPIEDLKADALFAAAEKAEAPTAAPTVSLAVLTEHVRQTVEMLDKGAAKSLAEDPPVDAAERAEMRQDVELDLQALRDPSDPNSHQAVQSIANRMAAEKGVDTGQPGFPTAEFFDLIRRGLVEVERRRLGRYDHGHAAPFYDPAFDPARAPAVTFGELADAYLAEKVAEYDASGVAQKRVDKVRAAVTTFRDIIGEKTLVNMIDDDMVQAARATVAKLPINRVLKYPKLTVAQAIEQGAKDKRATLSPISQGVMLDTFRDVLKLAVRKKYLTSNPAEGLKPLAKDKVALGDKRKPFTEAQIAQFFASPFYKAVAAGTYKKPDAAWRKWLPLLMAFTGARPNELCQLHIDDLKRTEKGTLYLDITDEGEGKKVKTKSSRRRVPLHKELIGLGFVEFVEGRRKAAGKNGPRLFHELKADFYGDNFAWYANKRFNEAFLRDAIELTDRQTLYSFRHSFRDGMRRAKAGPDALLFICGWSPSGAAVSDAYGDGGNPDLHVEAVNAVSYEGLSLDHLKALASN